MFENQIQKFTTNVNLTRKSLARLTTSDRTPALSAFLNYDLAKLNVSKLGYGMHVSTETNPPSIHLQAVSTKEIFSHIQEFKSDLKEGLSNHPILSATSPSINALRVKLLVLIKSCNDKETIKTLKNFLGEIKDIDLNDPKDLNWTKDLKLSIEETNINLSLKLIKSPIFTRAVNALVSTELSKDDREKKYEIAITIKNTDVAESESLIKLKNFGKQLVAISSSLALLGTACFAAKSALLAFELLSQKIVPSTYLNSIFEQFGNPISVCLGTIASFFLLTKLKKDISIKKT